MPGPRLVLLLFRPTFDINASKDLTESQALFLPEAADYIALNPTESVALARPMDSSPFVLGLRKAAKDTSVAINVGIHVPASNGKLLNRSCWINESGDIESYYDKLHLFDYGNLKESNSVEAGKEIVKPVETVVGRVGLTVCFDVSGSLFIETLESNGSAISVEISRNKPSTEETRCPNYYLPFCVHSTYW
jgi:predicted amidohydrolase